MNYEEMKVKGMRLANVIAESNQIIREVIADWETAHQTQLSTAAKEDLIYRILTLFVTMKEVQHLTGARTSGHAETVQSPAPVPDTDTEQRTRHWAA